jgi:prevent-host-death family protein
VGTVSITEAKTHLSKLMVRVEAGEEIVVQRRGTPVAKLIPYRPAFRRTPGRLKGRIALAEDFDATPPAFADDVG